MMLPIDHQPHIDHDPQRYGQILLCPPKSLTNALYLQKCKLRKSYNEITIYFTTNVRWWILSGKKK